MAASVTTITENAVADDGSAAGPETASARPQDLLARIRDRIEEERSWFLWTDPAGEHVYSPYALAALVTDLVGEVTTEIVAEQTAHLIEERVAAEDDVLDLLHDLEGGAASWAS